MIPSEKTFYSMKDVSELLGCSMSKVKTKLRYEIPSPLRIGNSLRWHRDSVIAYIKNCTEQR